LYAAALGRTSAVLFSESDTFGRHITLAFSALSFRVFGISGVLGSLEVDRLDRASDYGVSGTERNADQGIPQVTAERKAENQTL
jgi:hypothetical protein